MNNRWLAIVGNAILPGSGYILLKKRTTFGWLLLVGGSLGGLQLWMDPPPDIYLYGSNLLSTFIGLAAIALCSIAFGYDAYQLGKEK